MEREFFVPTQTLIGVILFNDINGNNVNNGNNVINENNVINGNKGSTKHTLCGIILFKLNTFFNHVFSGP
jgi:hypothetical protein